jgi:hypothetical protein
MSIRHELMIDIKALQAACAEKDRHIAYLHDVLAEADAVLDPEAHPELQARILVALGDEASALHADCAERAALGERAEAAEAALAAHTWQPIETAPKDGSFLVLLPLPHLNSRLQVATYHPNVQIVGGVFLFDLASQPTHWMPLPETPQ